MHSRPDNSIVLCDLRAQEIAFIADLVDRWDSNASDWPDSGQDPVTCRAALREPRRIPRTPDSFRHRLARPPGTSLNRCRK